MYMNKERRKPRVVILTAVVAYREINPSEPREEFEGELEGARWNSFGCSQGEPPPGGGQGWRRSSVLGEISAASYWRGAGTVWLHSNGTRRGAMAQSALEVKLVIFA